jgi:hypothetical protein
VSQEEARRVDRLTEILGLAADPSRTLLGRYAEFRGGLGELAGRLRAGEVDRSAARERAGHLRRGFEAELQIVLTEPQYDHLQQLRQLHHRQRHAHRDPAERWAEWLRAVGAGSQQQESILDALHSLRDGIQALRQQLRDERIDRSEAFAGAALLRAEFDARLRQLLTPEQFALLLVLRPDGVGGRP